jgi:glycine betaine/proline transport system substrate-binding protein
MHGRRRARLTTVVAIMGLAAGACGPADDSPAPSVATATAAAPSGSTTGARTVRIAINPWVGAEANVAVVKRLLEDKLGYTVTATPLAEEVAWAGFETGEIDVILENRGDTDLEKTYITDKGIAQAAGLNGVQGTIGWYVPEWLAIQYPDIVDWDNLNKYAELFKTSESGDQGQFLASDPTFVSNDMALIKNLDLDFKVVYSGSEAATITAFQQATEQKSPLIGYFYEPQWLHSKIELVRVKLPEWTEGCDAERDAVACDYPLHEFNKVVSTSFAENGGDAYTLVKNFSWTNDHQNAVAGYLANDKMTADEAGDMWIAENEVTWSAWMP